jgi:hypothetical protein
MKFSRSDEIVEASFVLDREVRQRLQQRLRKEAAARSAFETIRDTRARAPARNSASLS